MNDRTDIEAYRMMVDGMINFLPRPAGKLPMGVSGSDGTLYLLCDTGVSRVVPEEG